MFQPSKLLRLGGFAVLAFAAAFAIVLGSWSFTTRQIAAARSFGVFPSPAEGMLALTQSGYVGIQEARIEMVTQETALGGGPHVWFVSICIWADARSDGSAVGSTQHSFDYGGSYFVNTREGWVLMRENSMPLFVGFWMKVFGLAGSDTAESFIDPAGQTKPLCARQTV